MNSTSTPATHFFRLLTFVIMSFLVFGTIGGCRSGSYGRIAHSRQVTDMFNTYKIPPEPRYYYSGPDVAAFAFIGVHKEYTLESRFWKPVDLSPALLQTWLNFRSAQRKDISVNLYGANILGPNDEQIGYWYSVRDWSDVGTVKMGEGNVVHITTPRGEDPLKKRRGGDH